MALNFYNPPSTSNNDFLDSNNNFGQNIDRPYVKGVSTFMPQPMAGNVTEDDLYPLQSSLQTPQLNSPVISPSTQNFAQGGKVKRSRKNHREEVPNLFPMLAEMIRQQGGEEDTVLAHINPLEAQMLGVLAQGGKINPLTGLPQFGLFDNPKKWLKGSLGGGAGAIIGNMILPGIGGIIGGALGGAAGSAIRGRKDFGQAALRGASMGALLPGASSLLGTGISKLGFTNTGNFLTNYGNTNSILRSIGMEKLLGNTGGVSGGTGNFLTNYGNPGRMSGGETGNLQHSTEGLNRMASEEGKSSGSPSSYLDKWMKPKNLLTALTVGGSLLSRPKKDNPEKSGKELGLKQKAYDQAMQLTPQERALREADMLSERQMQRRLDRNQYLPEERFALKPTYRKINSPDEYERSKKWLQYYDNPEFYGNPLLMKKGGLVPEMIIEEEEFEYPSGEGYYFKGHTGGQDDKIPAKLSDGEYVIPADVVAHAGDGNSDAGAKHFDILLKNIRKSKGGKLNLPPRIKPLISYMR